MARIHFLTGNKGKVLEATHHLAPLGHEVVQLNVEGIVEPQAEELTSVAQAKLEQGRHHLPDPNDWLLVEDAGLFIEALDGFPGVYSSYVYQTIGCQGILRLLSHLRTEDTAMEAGLRKAEFRAVAALLTPEGLFIGQGTCVGKIAPEVDGEGGFGFDPIFVPRDLDLADRPVDPEIQGEFSTHGRSFGAVDLETKQRFSHRARALEDLVQQVALSD